MRLVTPGTLTEEKLLSPSDANYLMAVARIRGGANPAMALAWIDISTGIFRLSETGQSQLLADIMRIDPRELALTATRQALGKLGAAPCPSGSLPVIMENGFGGVVFHEAMSRIVRAFEDRARKLYG